MWGVFTTCVATQAIWIITALVALNALAHVILSLGTIKIRSVLLKIYTITLKLPHRGCNGLYVMQDAMKLVQFQEGMHVLFKFW